MNVLKILGIFFILFNEYNQSFSASRVYPLSQIENIDEEQGNIASQMSLIDDNLSLMLAEFKLQNPQIAYGITDIERLYDLNTDIDAHYISQQPHYLLKKILFGFEVFMEGGVGTTRYLTIFHPQAKTTVKVFMGFCIARVLLAGARECLNRFEKQPGAFLISIDQTDSNLVSQVSDAISDVCKADIEPVLQVSNKIIEISKTEELSEENLLKVKRLEFLTEKIVTGGNFKKRVLELFKTTSFLIDMISYISIAYTTRNSIPSYWLASLSSVAGSMCNYVEYNVNFNLTDFEKYITLSEIIYLCDELIKEDSFVV